MKQDFLKALQQLRQTSKKRNFDQTIDLVINLKGFDVRRETVNILVGLPYISKKKKICAFFENPNVLPHYTIAKKEMDRLDEKDISVLAKDYDFFIAVAKLMPTIASKFGRTLGPLGKMPDPKIGAVLPNEDENTVANVIKKLSNSVKVKTKESSIKVAIGKESMQDENVAENAQLVYSNVIEALPKKKENIRSVMLKFTMSKPIKITKQEKAKEED